MGRLYQNGTLRSGMKGTVDKEQKRKNNRIQHKFAFKEHL
jgi:hypothetical protein